MTMSATINRPTTNSDARFRHITIAILSTLAVAALVIVGSAGTASAHDGHGAEVSTRAGATETITTETTRSKAEMQAVDLETRNRAAQKTINMFHFAAINDVEAKAFNRSGARNIIQAPGHGQANPLNVDCYVDFDDDLTIQYHIPGGAENTFMTNHWFQKCFDSYHPAVAVKFLNHGHFHLGYEDPRVGPCSGNPSDWGRKTNPAPADSDDLGPWISEDCVSDIDPVTEPRSGILAHEPGHQGQIVAYDDSGHIPFQLRTFEVVSGEVEVCHRSAGPVLVVGGGGSPWSCTTWGEGYWDMSDHVPSAIEVRFEFLTNGHVDNIGLDLL